MTARGIVRLATIQWVGSKMSVRSLAEARPFAAAVLCAAAQLVLTLIVLKAGFAMAPPEAVGSVKLAAFASTIVLPLLLVLVFGLWRDLGLGWRQVRLTPVFVFSLATCALWLSMGVHRPEGSSVIGDVAMQLVNAFGEELLFRGVIFAILLTQARWQAILLNGVLFGSMHLIHGYMDGDWGAALHQAFFTVMGGMMFAAVRYSTRSLWLVILLHAGLNLAIIYSNVGAAYEPAFEWGVGLVEVAIAIWVMWQGREKAELQPTS
jgi:membrane protease YdiL (CAAX protease family)